jgi:hypothetical protein
VTENLCRDGDRRAMEACRQTRDDAAHLLKCIIDGGDTYFDRSEVAPDLDVTQEHAKLFQSFIDRMDVALAALVARCASGSMDTD